MKKILIIIGFVIICTLGYLMFVEKNENNQVVIQTCTKFLKSMHACTG